MTKKLLDKPTPTVEDLAKKYGVPVLQVKKQLLKGIKVEKEHTDHPKIAREIALDHLGERLDYYTKLDKAHLEEETGVSGVRGLGYVSGDPGVNPVSQYINTNAMSYEDENGNKLEYIKRQHADLHNNGLGYNFFDPTKIKSSSNFMNEATTTAGGLGGKHSPQGEGEKYLENNVKNADKESEIREKHAVGVHHDLHVDNGFNVFKHTNVKGHSNKELTEARTKVASKLDELGLILGKLNELGGSGEPNGYTGISDPPPKGRTNDQIEEGPLKDKAKKVAMAGMTAANMYTMADVAGRATEGGHGSPKGDVVRAASALPGVAGWGASAIHYGKKGYDLAKASLKKKGHMEEEKKMPNPCWKGYKAYGMKKKDGKEVPNCVPVEETAAWQRSAGKDPEGGLNRKGIASYRRENPGSKLSMAVTTEPSKLDPKGKAAKRRKSFCARMGGMKGPMKDEKGRPTRKALALRKWNCEEENNALPQTTQRGIYEKAPPGDKYERMILHIKDTLGADGLTDKEKRIAFATAWKAYNRKKLNEMDTDAFMRSAPASKNIIDKRPGLSTTGINNAVDTFKTSMKQSEIKDKIHSKYYGTPSTLDKVKSTVSNIGKGMTDVAKGMAGTARDTLGLDMDKPVVNDIAKTAARGISPVGSAVAKAASSVLPSNEPKKVDPANYDTSKAYSGLSASERGPISSPGGATPPSISKNSSIPSSMADMGSPSTPDTNFISKMDADTPKGLNSTNFTTPKRVDEISAELVGKVSNARFWRGEAPSKTLTRAINKKFIESGKKKEKTNKQVKENSKDKDWDEAVGPMGKGDVAEQGHLHLNKPDTAYAPGATGTTKTIYEETKMENQNLINEAIENILENDLGAMKDNLMAALQEKAQEKLEERKKEIAANYFAQ